MDSKPQTLPVLSRRSIYASIVVLVIGLLVACAPAGPELQVENV